MWARRAAGRQRQIAIGKARPEYQAYERMVPPAERTDEMPLTPDPHARISKRAFDRQLCCWRRRLHEFDSDVSCPIKDPTETPTCHASQGRAGTDMSMAGMSPGTESTRDSDAPSPEQQRAQPEPRHRTLQLAELWPTSHPQQPQQPQQSQSGSGSAPSHSARWTGNDQRSCFAPGSYQQPMANPNVGSWQAVNPACQNQQMAWLAPMPPMPGAQMMRMPDVSTTAPGVTVAGTVNGAESTYGVFPGMPGMVVVDSPPGAGRMVGDVTPQRCCNHQGLMTMQPSGCDGWGVPQPHGAACNGRVADGDVVPQAYVHMLWSPGTSTMTPAWEWSEQPSPPGLPPTPDDMARDLRKRLDMTPSTPPPRRLGSSGQVSTPEWHQRGQTEWWQSDPSPQEQAQPCTPPQPLVVHRMTSPGVGHGEPVRWSGPSFSPNVLICRLGTHIVTPAPVTPPPCSHRHGLTPGPQLGCCHNGSYACASQDGQQDTPKHMMHGMPGPGMSGQHAYQMPGYTQSCMAQWRRNDI